MGSYKPRVLCLDVEALASSSSFRYLRSLVPNSRERIKFGDATVADGIKLPRKFAGM